MSLFDFLKKKSNKRKTTVTSLSDLCTVKKEGHREKIVLEDLIKLNKPALWRRWEVPALALYHGIVYEADRGRKNGTVVLYSKEPIDASSFFYSSCVGWLPDYYRTEVTLQALDDYCWYQSYAIYRGQRFNIWQQTDNLISLVVFSSDNISTELIKELGFQFEREYNSFILDVDVRDIDIYIEKTLSFPDILQWYKTYR